MAPFHLLVKIKTWTLLQMCCGDVQMCFPFESQAVVGSGYRAAMKTLQ